MANYDAGHYFLTMMAPIERDGYVLKDNARQSKLDHIKNALVTLPTAQQDAVSHESGLNSPFARVPGTHFARFFVIDNLRYNGRRPSNAIANLILKRQLTIPEKVDTLNAAYLVMTIDFDAQDGSEASLRSYTDSLWRNMSRELEIVFGHCVGFEDISNERSFFEYVKRCQIVTTMPFNDYWTHEPPKPNTVLQLKIAAALVLTSAILAGVTGVWPWSISGLAAVALFATIAAFVLIIFRMGSKPFPPAPGSDLNSIMKALYIQQKFVRFATDNLKTDDKELFKAFDDFCKFHLPNDVSGPRQSPGVVNSDWDVK